MMRRVIGILVIAVSAIATAACGGDNIEFIRCRGTIAVAPTVLDFGAVPVDGQSEQELTVQNIAGCSVKVIGVIVDGGTEGAFTWVTDAEEPAEGEPPRLAEGDSLGADEKRTIVIRYAPTQADVNVGSVTVNVRAEDSGSEQAQARAQLFGVGANPDLFCDPPLIDLARVAGGSIADATAVLKNRGGVDVTIDSVEILPADPNVSAAPEGGQNLPVTLSEDQNLSVDVSYDAPDDSALEVDLVATTSDGRTAICRVVANNCRLSADPSLDADGDGVNFCAGDCDDLNPAVHDGATEIQDGLDNNCDGRIDEGTAAYDDDGDCYCDALPCMGSSEPDVANNCPGGALAGGDCDDSNPSINPGLTELLGNGIDDNCDALIDFDPDYLDDDGDGFSELGGDCDDANPARFPGNTEVGNGIDDDCDTFVDEGTPQGDDDGDGLSENGGDCNDNDPTINPFAPDLCDGIDNDCSGVVDDPCGALDFDGDGYAQSFGGQVVDCDDNRATIHPGAPELPDTIDNDCDGIVDEGTVRYDDDGDCFCESLPCDGSIAVCGVLDGGDCNDGVASRNPGQAEGAVGDGIDNNCNGIVDEGTDLFDDDGDGFNEDGGDCDDADDQIHPAALELVGDGIDSNCDGLDNQ